MIKTKDKTTTDLVIGRMEAHDHEQVLHCFDRATGLRAIIAIHDTTLGPALGGTPVYSRASTARTSSTLKISDSTTGVLPAL